MNILILFAELAGYFVACVNELANQTGATIHLVRLPVNKEAPFEFDLQHQNVIFHDRNSFSENELVDIAIKLNPKLILCSGWKDKAYLKISKYYFGKVPTILAFDNKWENTLKQNIASVISPFHIKNKFSHCFVPGPEQESFAKKLGFKKDKILTGVYSCDYQLFNNLYKKYLVEKEEALPRRFLFIGRYYEFKGCLDLWNAFIELKKENKNFDWELWCLGTGSLEPIKHKSIKHFGFVQPEKLSDFIRETSIFIMPSHIEPWGVVLHEMAAAGFPIIASNKVGSSKSFLINERNGYLFEAKNKDELKSSMLKASMLSDSRIIEMSKESNKLASQLTPVIWAKKIKKLL